MISSSLSASVLWSLAGLFLLLALASGVASMLKHANPHKDYQELILRIRSWWIMVSIFTVAMVLSDSVSLAFFAFISFLAVKEYFSIITTRRADRRVLFWVYLAIPFQYYWVAQEWYGMFIIFIPVYMFLLLPMRMVMIGDTRHFLNAVSTLHWGMMTLVFSLSHLAYLLVLPAMDPYQAGGAGLVLYLVFLTQFNDIAQYIWGKMLGKRKIIPKVSPNKTWEGFLGGFFTNKHEFDATLEHVFKLFPRLRERQSQRSGTMSGGEQQMLAIGRALMTKPAGADNP